MGLMNLGSALTPNPSPRHPEPLAPAGEGSQKDPLPPVLQGRETGRGWLRSNRVRARPPTTPTPKKNCLTLGGEAA